MLREGCYGSKSLDGINWDHLAGNCKFLIGCSMKNGNTCVQHDVLLRDESSNQRMCLICTTLARRVDWTDLMTATN